MEKKYFDTKHSLFLEIGDYEAIDKASVNFLKRVISDDSINDIFIDTDIQTLIREFNALFAYIIDAPIAEKKNQLKAGGYHLVNRKINSDTIDKLSNHLALALLDLNYHHKLVEDIMENIESFREDLIDNYRKVILVGLLKYGIN